MTGLEGLVSTTCAAATRRITAGSSCRKVVVTATGAKGSGYGGVNLGAAGAAIDFAVVATGLRDSFVGRLDNFRGAYRNRTRRTTSVSKGSLGPTRSLSP